MKIIDTHVHLGNIYTPEQEPSLEERTPETTHPEKPNTYEQMGFGNVYFGKINYLFKALITSSARTSNRLGNVPNLLDSMKNKGITNSVVLALEPNVSTDSILKVCQKHAALIPFCSIHPHDPQKREKLSRYIKAGCKGIKLHPLIQNIAADDPATLELVEEIKAYDLPILFHVGWGSYGNVNFGFAQHYKKLLQSFPKTTFIFAHMGFYEPFPVLELIKNYPNVYTDTSWQPAGIIKYALNKIGEDRIILGSDWPFSLQNTSLKIIEKITEKKPALREKILYKTAENLLKIS